MLADSSLPLKPVTRQSVQRSPTGPLMAHSPGAAKLLALMPRDWRGRSGVDKAIEAVARRPPRHPHADAVEQVWAELAWLRNDWAQSADSGGSCGSIHLLVEFISRSIATGNQDELLKSCHLVRSKVRDRVEQRLREACHEAEHQNNPYVPEWVEACAKLFLNQDGTMDTAVFPALEQLLGTDTTDLLPAGAADECRVRLRGLMDPRQRVPELVDGLTSIEPLHADVERLLCLQFGDTGRYPLGLMVLMTLLADVRQPENMGICWLVARNAAHLRLSMGDLLRKFGDWFRTGAFECMAEDGGMDTVVPELCPESALKWARKPVADWDDPESDTVLSLVKALGRAAPGWTDEHRARAVRAAGHALRDQGRKLTPLALLRHALIAHLNHVHGWSLTESRLNRPVDRQSPPLRAKTELFEAMLEDCLMVIESRCGLNLFSVVWPRVMSAHAKRVRLAESWDIIQAVLLDGIEPRRRPAGLDAYLERLKATFMSCATLRYERDKTSGWVGLRLHLRLPDATGRGTPVRTAEQLREWLQWYVRKVPAPESSVDSAACRACLASRLAEAGHGQFARWFAPRTASMHLAAPSDGVWFLNMGSTVAGDILANPHHLPPVAVLGGGGSDQFVELDLPTRQEQWDVGVVALVDSWAAPEKTLEGLLRLYQATEDEAGPEFQHVLERQGGRVVVDVPCLNDGSRHTMTLRLFSVGQDKPVRWIRTHLIKPMQEGLRTHLMDQAEAANWLRRVLNACDLKEGAKVEAAVQATVQRAMQRAMKRSLDAPGSCRLSDLVVALRWMRRNSWKGLFRDLDPRRNGLSVALLNHLPFKPPSLGYADPNWERGAERLYYALDIATGRVGHFCGHEARVPAMDGRGGVRPRMVAVLPPYLFC